MTDNNFTGKVLAGKCLAPVLIYSPGKHMTAMGIAALIDTGAQRSAISQRLAGFLGLPQIGCRMVASGFVTAQSTTFLADLEFLQPGLVGASWPIRQQQMDEFLMPMVGSDVLIGMDIIGQGKLVVGASVWSLEF